MSKHTPGPWRLADHGEIVGATRRIAYMQPFGANQMLGGEGIANARLISAAPELLTALKDLLAWANISDDPGRASDQAACVARNARAAIAKAEGT